MMEKLICPSMMCADFSNLKKEVELLDSAGVDVFHMDIMDGNFVPNFGMGLQDFELVRKTTEKQVDVHLMIQNPDKYVEKFIDLGADIIYIHPEADIQPARTLDIIRQKGKKTGIAINPGTSLEMVTELLTLVDYFMVMTVNPGFAGQKYLEYVNEKIIKIVELSKVYDYKVMVDGAISPEKVSELSAFGVEGFVLGTSALFGKKQTYKEIVKQLKNN
ncbi:ribulose-phosphate 3-epimerase [Paraliobacillus sp. JSM ZJ581]|uniref:ribulose-phosphate 3-epimerase n=1 Tax=Paraliobacillus sp. JSM ZJ581 TaxID=3342118 RepID=UPI0035A98B43